MYIFHSIKCLKYSFSEIIRVYKLKDVIKDIQWIIERGRMCREDLQMIVEEVYKITKELERWGSLDT
jgi:hypothetical protein